MLLYNQASGEINPDLKKKKISEKSSYLIEQGWRQNKLPDLCNWIELDVRKYYSTKQQIKQKYLPWSKEVLSTNLPVISHQKNRAVSLQRGRTKITWNIQECVSSQYRRKGIQGSLLRGCPETWWIWTKGQSNPRCNDSCGPQQRD